MLHSFLSNDLNATALWRTLIQKKLQCVGSIATYMSHSAPRRFVAYDCARLATASTCVKKNRDEFPKSILLSIAQHSISFETKAVWSTLGQNALDGLYNISQGLLSVFYQNKWKSNNSGMLTFLSFFASLLYYFNAESNN